MARTRETGNERETGLLTRFVPERLKHTALYRWWLRSTRVLQFLSSVISLGIFSSRFYRVYRLVNLLRSARNVDRAFGAVEGILAAAVLYTIIATLMMCLMRGGGPKWLRWLWVIFDILFVGAFIAVAVLTSPNGVIVGPKHCYDTRNQDDNDTGNNASSNDDSCNLPWGTFILAIISTILHAITAGFNEVKHRHNEVKHRHRRNKLMHDKTGNGVQGGHEAYQPRYEQPLNGHPQNEHPHSMHPHNGQPQAARY